MDLTYVDCGSTHLFLAHRLDTMWECGYISPPQVFPIIPVGYARGRAHDSRILDCYRLIGRALDPSGARSEGSTISQQSGN